MPNVPADQLVDAALFSLEQGAGGLMDRLGDMSPFGRGSESETTPE
jgi:hypothetical protein